MKNKVNLKIDWASHEAALFACKNWHYSKCLPVGKLVKVGAWERESFIGVVVFGRGATPNLGKPYGLNQDECVELVRVALTKHESNVSRIVAIAIKFLVRANSKLKLIVSFADQSQGHHGGIYQAGNWIYTGQGAEANFYDIKGKLTHPRSLGAKGLVQNINGARQLDKFAKVVRVPGKYRYLMPLNKAVRNKVELLRKPYPKRVGGVDSDTPAIHAGEGGASPTSTLHINELQK